MARQICIKTATGMYCKSSAIRDCSCDRDQGFEDPFPEVPKSFANPKALLADLDEVLRRVPQDEDPGEVAERFHVLATIARLVFLPEVKIKEPFLIMSMDLGIPTPALPSAD